MGMNLKKIVAAGVLCVAIGAAGSTGATTVSTITTGQAHSDGSLTV